MFLVACFAVWAIWHQGKQEARFILEIQTRINDLIARDAVLTAGEKALKYQKFYAKIIGVHQDAGYAMGRYMSTDFIRLCWRYTVLLDLPEFYLMTTAVMESSFNPSCKGGIGEIGMFQHHKSVLDTIYRYQRLLYAVMPEAGKELDPMITKHEDLYNPITSLKAQAVLAWGLRREYPDEIYWISASHWGSAKVDPWYTERREPKDRFVFYSEKKLNKIDSRSPLQYYFHYARIVSNFDRFNVDIGKWVDEYRAYRDKCNEDERRYIDNRETVAKLIRTAQRLEEREKEIEEMMKDVREYKEKLKGLEAEYGKIYGEAKRGKITYETMYARTKKMLKEFIK
jgi:hypothetical protein